RIQYFTSVFPFTTYTYWGQYGQRGTGNDDFWDPIGIAVDINGNFYFADSVNSRVKKPDFDWSFLSTWTSSGYDLGRFQFPYGMAQDSQGRVYVADYLNLRLQVLDANLNPLETYNDNDGPNGIAIDS